VKVLRVILIVYALAYVGGALMIFLSGKGGWSLGLGAYLTLNALVIIAATLFERGRYRPKTRTDAPGWKSTGERFRDDSSGKLMEVRYNSQTGQRDYVEVDGE
jgi:hypothetical protein